MASDVQTHAIGESAGTGQYRCCKCGGELTLTGPRDQLPPCPQCGTGADVRYTPVDGHASTSKGIESQQR
ncbi:MAG: hypothetical protein CMJ58_02875 [Planctomycetaceae bacterium]|nr:hypothetical protein [Planctomycetaceae bacterium]